MLVLSSLLDPCVFMAVTSTVPFIKLSHLTSQFPVPNSEEMFIFKDFISISISMWILCQFMMESFFILKWYWRAQTNSYKQSVTERKLIYELPDGKICIFYGVFTFLVAFSKIDRKIIQLVIILKCMATGTKER